ncbi:MAG: tyrosine-type recombinase/integrase [Firmicutes bacterium]|nr:tyrosine-type recombinase/integrase [Bacillota bacterium]MBR0115225.1 tyrosine-type recombinase/integrase [Bacillota bacterium]
MEEKKRKLLNRTDKPDNVVERENEILEKCGRIEEELPSWLRGYFMYLRSNVLPMTRLAYLQDIRFFCEYLLKETELAPGITKIKDLKPEHFNGIKAVDINIYIDWCRRYTVDTAEGTVIYENRNSSLSRKKSSVSVFFKYLYRDGFVEKNITDGFDPIRLPKPGEREIKALQDDEVMKMLDSVTTGSGLTKKEQDFWEKTKQRDKLILLLLVTYGLRLSELQQLNVSSFNFDRGEFKIYRKRGKESIMPINRTITEAFSDYVNLERPSDDTLDEENKDALLLSLRGTRLTDRQIRQIVKKYTSVSLGTSRDKGYSPHKLRATAATSLIARGNSIYDVQELLDHDNVTTTQLYAAHKLNTKRELIKNFEWDEDMKKPGDEQDDK